MERYLNAYDPVINSINGQEMWPRPNLPPILPPHYQPQPGRPKKLRRRDPNSPMKKTSKRKLYKMSKTVAKVYKCGLCKKTGYNKRAYPLNTAQKENKTTTAIEAVVDNLHERSVNEETATDANTKSASVEVTVELVQMPTQTQQEHQLGTLKVGTVRLLQPIVGIVGPSRLGVL
ncbi:hypothetical protein ACH5RR_009503 [Cinchona calisaya]|uniref:Zinc finger protein n=1 Tax=Cinchona calisaya TaxID=153742 RepID=A0ABD3AEG7_9GENT